jgi:DNA-binding MarR family transcriptional regulator
MTTHPRERLVPELLHPLRLSIVAKIVGTHSITFRELRDDLGVSDATLSKQCSILETTGLVSVTKTFVGKTPRTRLSMTADGEARWADHRTALCELIGVETGPFSASPSGPRDTLTTTR